MLFGVECFNVLVSTKWTLLKINQFIKWYNYHLWWELHLKATACNDDVDSFAIFFSVLITLLKCDILKYLFKAECFTWKYRVRQHVCNLEEFKYTSAMFQMINDTITINDTSRLHFCERNMILRHQFKCLMFPVWL